MQPYTAEEPGPPMSREIARLISEARHPHNAPFIESCEPEKYTEARRLVSAMMRIYVDVLESYNEDQQAWTQVMVEMSAGLDEAVMIYVASCVRETQRRGDVHQLSTPYLYDKITQRLRDEGSEELEAQLLLLFPGNAHQGQGG